MKTKTLKWLYSATGKKAENYFCINGKLSSNYLIIYLKYIQQ